MIISQTSTNLGELKGTEVVNKNVGSRQNKADNKIEKL